MHSHIIDRDYWNPSLDMYFLFCSVSLIGCTYWTLFCNLFVFSFSQSEETLSVYLEYVSGGSIHKLLQEYGAFTEPVIQNYTRQILSGLAYLHGRNTVHRYALTVIIVNSSYLKSQFFSAFHWFYEVFCYWQGYKRSKHISGS